MEYLNKYLDKKGWRLHQRGKHTRVEYLLRTLQESLLINCHFQDSWNSESLEKKLESIEVAKTALEQIDLNKNLLDPERVLFKATIKQHLESLQRGLKEETVMINNLKSEYIAITQEIMALKAKEKEEIDFSKVIKDLDELESIPFDEKRIGFYEQPSNVFKEVDQAHVIEKYKLKKYLEGRLSERTS